MTNHPFTEIPLTAVGSTGGGCCGGGSCSCGHGDASSTALPASGSTAVESTAVYQVTGMTCGHCSASVTEEVSALAGVSSVQVDLQAHGISRVHVTSEHPLDVDDVRDAIIEAGYQLLEA